MNRIIMQGLIYFGNVTAFGGGLAVLERTWLGQNTADVLSRVLIKPRLYCAPKNYTSV